MTTDTSTTTKPSTSTTTERPAGPGTDAAGVSWGEVEATEPEFTRTVRERFGTFRHHVLATLRADGSPRVSGLEAEFRLGELWLGGMPGARKSDDLLRDQRFALHANPGPGTDMHGGDVRIAGRAEWVDDPDTRRRFVEEVDPPTPFDLFRVRITEIVRIWMDDQEMVIETWRPDGRGLRVLRRGNDTPVREQSGP
ncbi:MULTISPECIES: pyridoxamine 5'-phosphate oxidase family protein [unclassified Parafrankia]|uniref:pyridoxamine 5'-phosphate oxidase family protein n=1 Tax=Parafrankia TaxID=2994362 RepID=UPI000DA572DB|nr:MULTISPECIES: pyridoxamine 5'-phosphate oxidase family protein [unclassified Parafrankia]SQD95512.1 Pyridoxamine 5'-phosphate oxidase-related FMN-binding [Parafrankia sp. Ea1.12]